MTSHGRSRHHAVGAARLGLIAAHVERLRTLHLMDPLAARVAGALLMALRALDVLFATILTIAYSWNAAGIGERLGRATPGDNVQRLVPLMEVLPLWLHVLAFVAATLYLAGGAALLARRRSASMFVVLGVVAEAVVTAIGRRIALDVGILAVPHPSVIAVLILPIVLPLLVAFAAWSTKSVRLAS